MWYYTGELTWVCHRLSPNVPSAHCFCLLFRIYFGEVQMRGLGEGSCYSAACCIVDGYNSHHHPKVIFFVSIACSIKLLLLIFEGFQTVRIGVVGTPVGTVTLSCAYRTNLALMSNRSVAFTVSRDFSYCSCRHRMYSERVANASCSCRQFERSGPIMGIIVDHFVDPPCGSQRPANMGQPCKYRYPIHS